MSASQERAPHSQRGAASCLRPMISMLPMLHTTIHTVMVMVTIAVTGSEADFF